MKKLLIWVPLALFAFFVGLAAYQLTQPKDDTVRSGMIGKPVPKFDLVAYNPDSKAPEARVTEAVFRDGKPKLLNLWASWCLPCRVEAPMLDALEQQGVEIVGAALHDKPDDISMFLAQYGDPFSVIARDDMSLLQLNLGASGVPETFVIDGQGVIRYQHVGPIMERDVPVLLQELEKAR